MPNLDASVLICTYNRAGLLGDALDSLARMRHEGPRTWEVLIVDNNSTDATRQAVESRQQGYPVPLRYVFEGRQGKSHALNTGIAVAHGRIIVFGDDDQRFGDDWINESCEPLDADPSLDYTGGPVRPLWDARQPAWLDASRAELNGPLGMFDYGADRFIFEQERRIAAGGNMAVRRALCISVGGFCADLGRTGTSLLGQEQAEFFQRTRAAGARGIYVPTMIVYHHVPADRLRKQYFRRWWYWRGVSRARVDSLHTLHESGIDLTRTPRIAGVPRYMVGRACRDAAAWMKSWIARREVDRLIVELRLSHFTGYVREAQRQRGAGSGALHPRPRSV